MITDKAARAAQILILLRTKSIRGLFSELYAQVFLFYRDAMEWYMKSKAARFIDSFNEKMKGRYEKAAARMEVIIQEMYRTRELGHHAMDVVHWTEQQRRAIVSIQRRQTKDKDELACAGRKAEQLCLSHHRRAWIEAWNARQTQGYKPRDALSLYERPMAQAPSSLIIRATAKELAVGTQEYIVGDEGHSLFNDGKFWLPHVDVAAKLSHWIGNEKGPSTLWITSLEVSQVEVAGSRAAALNALVAAWTAELPVISHFCKRPRYATLAQGREEKVGLIGLVYSLIAQLLQFEFEDDLFEIPREQIESLDGSDESWRDALSILSTLLKATPHLGTCIIDGLNDLTFLEGSEWCSEFLGMLFMHQKSSPSIFRILLTTAGRSRVLQDHVQDADRFFTQTETEETIRDGRWYKIPES
ncbi:phytanoyl-CoA dioxygenase family protein [Stemphylium lycopersici]|uniref:Phytanoyl-CoA dioxygenase family protein n=1 Tax=Stemphylium lycopersici TaxID=183478 RepID=A0A364NH53_STELY|nr:phytanoyl-CoA dioxygenase family protein [Stemphylium lycopersici]